MTSTAISKVSPHKVVNVVLDIDSVLGTHDSFKKTKLHSFFTREDLFIRKRDFYLFPGVLEGVKFFNQLPDVRVSFFSAGGRHRNRDVVNYIWARSGTGKASPLLLSRKNLTQGCMGKPVKDIRKVLKFRERLVNSVLLDDTRGNSARGQTKNLLYIPETTRSSFNELLASATSTDKNGQQKIPCLLSIAGVLPQDLRGVERGEFILIAKKERGFRIYFLKMPIRRIHCMKITSQKNPKLSEILDFYARQMRGLKLPLVTVASNAGISRRVRRLVAAKNGKIHRIFHAANRIYYAVGLFYTAYKMAQMDKIPLAKALHKLQFKQRKGCQISNQLENTELFYFIGLEKLRHINPKLQFISSSHF